jgi:hypothetical protein
MSQNHIQVQGAGGPVHLIMGYDRPLGQIFCSAMPADDADPTDYSTLLFRRYADVAALREALQAVGLTVPEPVFAAVQNDVELMAGNVVRRFDAQGVPLSD